MRNQTRRRLSWPTAAVLAVVLGAPGVARAQQGGLFPLAPIRRERPPCAAEDPVYRLYRQEYFGYHPTCWRKFPTGWGCPSPEAPNAAESFRLLPRDEPPPGYGPEEGAEPGPDMGQDAQDAQGGQQGLPAPNSLPPLPSGDRSPFELDPRPQAAPDGNPAEVPGVSVPNDPTGPTELPSPGEGVRYAPAPGSGNPLLALPDPTVNPTSDTGFPEPSVEGPPPPPVNPVVDGGRPPQTPAPRRQGLIGRLFSGKTFRR